MCVCVLQNSSCMVTNFSSHKPSKKDKHDMLGTAGDVRVNASVIFSYGSPTHRHTSVGLTSKDLYQLCVNTGCSLQDLLRPMEDSDKWQVRVRTLYYQHNLIYINTAIYISTLANHGQGWPEGSFQLLLHRGVGDGSTPFPGLLHLPLIHYHAKC